MTTETRKNNFRALHGCNSVIPWLQKRKKALTKINSFRESFEKRKKETEADLEEAGRIWKELGKRFKWWQELP